MLKFSCVGIVSSQTITIVITIMVKRNSCLVVNVYGFCDSRFKITNYLSCEKYLLSKVWLSSWYTLLYRKICEHDFCRTVTLIHLQMTLILTTGVNIINILFALFLPTSFCQKITKPKCYREKLLNYIFEEKNARKTLMKLTP